MSLVKHIKNHGEYTQLLSAADPKKLVVVDFTAAWCGPCQMIAPKYTELSTKYRHVTFAKVDVDEVQETAQAAGVTAMPTFQFYKANKRIGELKGANPSALEQLIKQHQGPVAEAEGGSSSVSALVGGHSDLSEFIDMKQVECLNQTHDHGVKNVFVKSDSYLQSDVDEQLIVSVPFNQLVRVFAIQIVPTDLKHAPKTIKLFVNRAQIVSFSDADDVEETQTIEFTEKDYKENQGIVQLRFVKFQNVTNVMMFVKDNLGEEEVTSFKQLVLYGSPLETTRMSELKKIGHDHE